MANLAFSLKLTLGGKSDQGRPRLGPGKRYFCFLHFRARRKREISENAHFPGQSYPEREEGFAILFTKRNAIENTIVFVGPRGDVFHVSRSGPPWTSLWPNRIDSEICAFSFSRNP